MMEINRHIEILLLSNDCVIVPGLGGFMAHHQYARYDESDNMFIPPLRTLGFNPQLSMSDPLLAQSFADVYDISYPEAVVRVEEAVQQIKQTLEHDGHYDIPDIGTLSMTESGRYTFTPCEAGILSPSYYGLSTFEMPKLSIPFVQSTPGSTFTPLHSSTSTSTPTKTMSEETKKATEEKTISIKVSVLRNLAVASVAAAALFFFARPIDHNAVTGSQPTEASTGLFTEMMPNEESIGTLEFTSLMNKVEAFSKRVEKENVNVNVNVKAPENGTYTIVLAYRVPLENAQIFVKNLHENGVKEAKLISYKEDNVVVYGSYSSKDEALPVLNDLVKSRSVTDGWIMLME